MARERKRGDKTMKEGEFQPTPTPEDPKKPLSDAIVKILEGYNSLCMDDPLDRQRLADVLSTAIWEAEWRMENEATTDNFDPFDPDAGGYDPEDLYGF